MKRWLKTLLVVIAIFLIPTLWLLISHIIAKRAVEKYKAQLRAAGEKLTIAELQPSHLPPDQNGAKLVDQAFHDRSYGGPIESNSPLFMRMTAPGKAMIGWQQPEIVSQRTIQQFTNSWADFEQELTLCSPEINLLHQASSLPRIDFQRNYRDIVNLGGDQGLAMFEGVTLLSAATVFDLHQGDTTASVTNLHVALALINAWDDESEPSSQIVRMAQAEDAVQPQWELLQATNLTDAELAFLQHDWESMDFVRHLEHALENERALDEITTRGLRSSNSPPVTSPVGLSAGMDIARGASRKISDILWRASWSYGDELRVLQRDQVTINCVRRIETNGFFKDAVAEQDRRLSAIPLEDTTNNWLRGHLEDELGPSLWNAVDRLDAGVDELLNAEVARRLSITAIALKRYQLRRRNWPADLKSLVPEFLSEVPRDPVDGLPLRYRPNADGTFALYSIGINGIDDGGDPTNAPDSGNLNWLHGQDWVWPQPATPEEIQKYYTTLQQPTSVYK